MSNNDKDKVSLRNLLFTMQDLYADWHFYIKDKLLKDGLQVKGTDIELSDASFEITLPNSTLPSYIEVVRLTEMDFANEGANSLFFRKHFPSILLFPYDELSITKNSDNTLLIKLNKGDKIFRELVEDTFFKTQENKSDLIKRISLNIRVNSIDLKKVLGNLNLPFPPDLSDKELWEWFNKQDSQTFWSQLGDLQALYEANLQLTGPQNNYYFISLFQQLQSELIDFMENRPN